jgi:hypothetical protein
LEAGKLLGAFFDDWFLDHLQQKRKVSYLLFRSNEEKDGWIGKVDGRVVDGYLL